MSSAFLEVHVALIDPSFLPTNGSVYIVSPIAAVLRLGPDLIGGVFVYSNIIFYTSSEVVGLSSDILPHV